MPIYVCVCASVVFLFSAPFPLTHSQDLKRVLHAFVDRIDDEDKAIRMLRKLKAAPRLSGYVCA